MWTCEACGARNWDAVVACHTCRRSHILDYHSAAVAVRKINTAQPVLKKYPPLMCPKQIERFERIRDLFEGRQAILREKGMLRVRVLEVVPRHRSLYFRVQEIPTTGLGTGGFEFLKQRPECRFEQLLGSSASAQPTFSPDSWSCFGTTLWFAPETVASAVVAAALTHAQGLDALTRYDTVHGRTVFPRNQSRELIFPDHEKEEASIYESPPSGVSPRGPWVDCPRCGYAFKVSDARAWDKKRHRFCGQRLVIQDA